MEVQQFTQIVFTEDLSFLKTSLRKEWLLSSYLLNSVLRKHNKGTGVRT
jgi:hypothetical protein